MLGGRGALRGAPRGAPRGVPRYRLSYVSDPRRLVDSISIVIYVVYGAVQDRRLLLLRPTTQCSAQAFKMAHLVR